MLLVLANLLLAFGIVTCLVALILGTAAERLGSGIILANLVAYAVNEAVGGAQLIGLSIDAVTAVALLMVTLRYTSVWLGAVMVLYGAQFALHAYYFVLEAPRDLLHTILNNANFFAVVLCLAAGTLSAIRRRKTLRTAAASH